MADTNQWMHRALHDDAIEPAGIDTSEASIARVYDYVLGGKDNFAVDREAGDKILAALPDAVQLPQDNRAMLRRVVRYLVGEAGIRQLIDIGSGLPTAGNVHEIAHEIDQDTRVAYVDNDPVVLAHGRALLANNQTTTVVAADLRDAASIFAHPETSSLIDETKPFAVLLAGIVHHLEDEEDPAGVVAALRDRLPSGGYLHVSNFYDSGGPRVRELERSFLEGGLGTGRFRTREQQRQYFDGLELVDPGLVPANEWRADADTPTASPVHHLYLGGLGKKP